MDTTLNHCKNNFENPCNNSGLQNRPVHKNEQAPSDTNTHGAHTEARIYTVRKDNMPIYTA